MDTPADNALVHDIPKVDRPYDPSWVDRFTDWVKSLPVPAWLFYLVVWVVLFSIETAIKWYDGTYPAGTVFLYHTVLTLQPVYFLAMIHYLDDVADAGLKSFRPALTLNQAEYDSLRYQLTTMRQRPVLIAGGIGLLVFLVLVAVLSDPHTLTVQKMATSPVASVYELIVSAAGWLAQGIFAYHTIHQLRLVSRTYTTAARINLFHRRPLYGLSRLTMRTGIAWVLIPYAVVVSTPGVIDNPGTIISVPLLTMLALVIFAGPLLGVRRLLTEEKRRLLDENSRQMEANIAETHRRLNEHDLTDIGALKDAMENLVLEQGVLNKMSVWPWQVGTVGTLVTALLLPFFLWIIERLLGRFLGF
jgi:hypothetical protein